MSDEARVALYLRVSKDVQEISNQRPDLMNYIKGHTDWTLYKEYSDIGFSGAKAKRPGLDALMADARKGKFNTVLVWRFDRFARSTKHLLDALTEFRKLGIRFISHRENIDLGTALGEAVFVICSAVSQLERDIIRERIVCALRRCKAEGRPLGRKPIDPDGAIAARVIEALQGEDHPSVRQLASRFSLSRSYVHNLVKKHKQSTGTSLQPLTERRAEPA